MDISTTINKKYKTQDTAWKLILDSIFQEFVEFCMPDLYDLVDWSQGYTAIEQEFIPENKHDASGLQIVDKLFKVILKTSAPKLVLVNVEVQNNTKKKSQNAFLQRLFDYHLRIYLKTKESVITCAVLADQDPKWRPKSFCINNFGYSKTTFEFTCIKVLNYQQNMDLLANNPNIFAQVLLVQLNVLLSKKSDSKLALKLQLARRLRVLGYTKEKIAGLLKFLDWLVSLPQDLELQYEQEIKNLTKEAGMQPVSDYVSHYERAVLEVGIERGIEQGVHKGQCELLRLLLIQKFQNLPEKYNQIIDAASHTTICDLVKLFVGAQSIDEIFRKYEFDDAS